MPNAPKPLHYILLAAIALIWGSQFIFNQIVIRELPPLTLAAGRAGIGFLTLAILGLFFPHERRQAASCQRQSLSTYLLLAIFEALLPLCLLAWGQSHVESSIASILMGTIPIFTVLMAPAFVRGKHWTMPTILSVLTGFIGIIILMAPDVHTGTGASLAGSLAILGASASVSVSLLLFHRLGHISPIISVRNILGLAALPLIILSLIVDQPWKLAISGETIFSLVMLGVFCAGIVYLMFARLIQLAGSVFTSLTNYLVPPVGVLVGAIVANETVGLNAWLALTLIVLSIVINQPRLLRRLLCR